MADEPNIRKKLRELKKLEIRLRFNGEAPPGRALVWDGFFGRGKDGRAAKYPIETLASMERETFKRVVEEYFALVYYELYRECGIARAAGAYDPKLLARFGLPFSA
ncbi:MAG TPA: J domain-containing protein, partial [Clostridia bacterium]|nr:J domain-containing protein [Clostridia bacterium]